MSFRFHCLFAGGDASALDLGEDRFCAGVPDQALVVFLVHAQVDLDRGDEVGDAAVDGALEREGLLRGGAGAASISCRTTFQRNRTTFHSSTSLGVDRTAARPGDLDVLNRVA